MKKLLEIINCEPYKLQLIDSAIMIGEFFYRCGEFELASRCYSSVIQISRELLSDSTYALAISGLECNLCVCNYMRRNIHNPSDLINRIISIMESISFDAKSQEFKSAYIFLITALSSHNNLVQHNDILMRLNKISITRVQMVDIYEPIKCLKMWENFIVFGENSREHVENFEIYNIIYNIQSMVYWFCNNNYALSRRFYNVAKGIATRHCFLELYKIADKINKNIIEIYNSNFK